MDRSSLPFEIEQSVSLRQALVLDVDPEISAPLRAGMRARAIADRCEQAGLAAVFVDASGSVLHVSSRASASVHVAAGHLVGRTRAENAALETALNDALATGAGGARHDDGPSRVAGLPCRDPSSHQLLRGVLLFDAAMDHPEVMALRFLLSGVQSAAGCA